MKNLLEYDKSAGGMGKTGEGKKKIQDFKPEDVPINDSTLEALWKRLESERTGIPQPGFTGKEKGQLKHFVNRVGAGRARSVMEKVLQDWIPYCEHVRARAAIREAPTTPQLGFLLRFCREAATFAEPKPEEPVVQKKSAQLIAHPPKPEGGYEEPLSYEELKKAMEED